MLVVVQEVDRIIDIGSGARTGGSLSLTFDSLPGVSLKWPKSLTVVHVFLFVLILFQMHA